MGESLLFLKLGGLAAEPDNFFEDLAGTFQAKCCSTYAVRAELGVPLGKRNGGLRSQIDNALYSRASAALQEGNVIVESAVNSLERREKMRGIARLFGARVVLLWTVVEAATATQRIKERYKDDTLPFPNNSINLPRILRTFGRGGSSIQAPHLTSESHLMLYGGYAASELVERVVDYVRNDPPDEGL